LEFGIKGFFRAERDLLSIARIIVTPEQN